MTVAPNQVFSFLTASALLGNTGNTLKKKDPATAPTKTEDRVVDEPVSLASTFVSDDDCSVSSHQSSGSLPRPCRRPVKSILKPVSAYGPSGSKNPKSLRRGFMSMHELASLSLVPEDGAAPCSGGMCPAFDGSDDGAAEFQDSGFRPLSRSVSFGSPGSSSGDVVLEIRRVDSLSDLANDNSDIWYQKDQLKGFVTTELTRRMRKGINSTVALCPEAGCVDEEEERVRRPTNYPRGVRR